MTATIATALLAVVVFVLTQGFLKLVLEPLQEQRKLVGEVASALTVYEKSFTVRVFQPSSDVFEPEAVYLGATREEAMEAAKTLRKLSGGLQAGLWAVPLYDLFALLHLVPTAVAVVVATDALRMWYSQLPNAVNEHQAQRIRECQDTISKTLGIERRLQAVRAPAPSSERP